MINSEVSVDSLIVPTPDLDDELAKLDKLNPEHRSVVLQAIERFIYDYVLKASDCPPSRSEFFLYDEEEVLGHETEGLTMNLFGRQMPGLKKPSDEQLNAAMERYGLGSEADGPQQRDKFYRCWAANHASATLLGLLNFLEFSLPNPPRAKLDALRAELMHEQQQLQQMLEHKLPGEVEYVLRSAAEFLGRHAAATTTSA